MDFFSRDEFLADIYRGKDGLSCHPNSPMGGGGCFGASLMPGPLGLTSPSGLFGSSFPHPLSPSARLLTPQQIEKAFSSKSFGVANIPSVMREKMAWPKSAALMDLWLNAPTRVMTAAEKSGETRAIDYPTKHVSKELITVDWLLKFKSAADGYSDLLTKFNTRKAVARLKEIIRSRAGLPGSGSVPISNVLDPVELHSTWQFQLQNVGFDLFAGLDDLYGSLGRFAWYAAVVEAIYTAPAKGSPGSFNVSKVGIYVRDTFDFNGGQYLGHWNEKGVRIDKVAALGVAVNSEFECDWPMDGGTLGRLQPINNSDFNSYRDKNKKGGDLLVFSDVRVENVAIEIKL